MPPLRIPIDGLWRCLCPSVDAITTSSPKLCFRTNSGVARGRVRQLHSSLKLQNDSTSTSTSSPLKLFKPMSDTPSILENEPNPFDARNSSRPLPKLSKRQPATIDPSYFPELDKYSIAQVEDILRSLLSKPGAYNKIAQTVHYLIAIRGEKPSVRHYDALIRANADPEWGSVDVVKVLLDEMEELGIRGNVPLYEGVLLVLAIHPDYMLRAEVMHTTKERWFGLSHDAWHWLIVGLIRDQNFEIALEKLEHMQADRIIIHPWLYDIMIFQLCEHGELDEAWKMLKYRWEHDRSEIGSGVYYYLLDRFSHDFHYEGVKFIWKVRVQGNIMVPSDGMCIAVLDVAARNADAGLATSVMRILATRRSALAPFHYEALIAAYASSQDLETAFRLLYIMAKAGVQPTLDTTRSIYVVLSNSKELTLRSWQTLTEIHEEGHAIATQAVNVVLEAHVAHKLIDQALSIYKELHTICEAGPNIDTFNVLLQGASQGYKKDVSMFLAGEMHVLGILPDDLTYDRLILICLMQEDYEDAFRYLDEMITVGKGHVHVAGQEAGWWMRPGTATLMVKTCLRKGDPRGWDVLEEMKTRGQKVDNLQTWAKQFSDMKNKESHDPSPSAGRANRNKTPENGEGDMSLQELRARQEERLRKLDALA